MMRDLRIAMVLFVGLACTPLGCGKSQPPPAAVPAPVEVEWPDAAPLPTPDKPAPKAGESTDGNEPAGGGEVAPAQAPGGADASKSTGSSG